MQFGDPIGLWGLLTSSLTHLIGLIVVNPTDIHRGWPAVLICENGRNKNQNKIWRDVVYKQQWWYSLIDYWSQHKPAFTANFTSIMRCI